MAEYPSGLVDPTDRDSDSDSGGIDDLVDQLKMEMPKNQKGPNRLVSARTVFCALLVSMAHAGSADDQTADQMVSDLALSFGPLAVETSQWFETNLVVTNLGPDESTDIEVTVQSHEIDRTWGGPATTCEATTGGSICRISALGPGERVALSSEEIASDEAGVFPVIAAITSQSNHDPDATNDALDLEVPVGYEQVSSVLIPLLIERSVRGAQGTYWRHDLAVFIDSDTNTFMFPVDTGCNLFGACSPFGMGAVFPNERWLPKLKINPEFPGYMLHYDARKAGSVSFSHRVRELTRFDDAWGTEIPVVFDGEFIEGAINILDLPSGPRYRKMLRIYQPDALPSTITVRAWGGPRADELIGERVVSLNVPYAGVTNGLPAYASYGQFDIDEMFGTFGNQDRARIEIEPQNDQRHWAFVSVTNNETQAFSIITPQQGN